jgi:hypothetical protein
VTGAKRLTVFSVNWGRGVDAVKFRNNVLRVLDSGGDDAVLGIQELDEADTPHEHEILRKALDGTETLVGWRTFEPLVIPGHLHTMRADVVPMCDGLAGYTPARFLVEALVKDQFRPNVPPVVFMNFHPPINRPLTLTRRRKCRRVHKERIDYWYARGRTIVWTSDTNDITYPKMHPREKVAMKKGFDNIRYIEHPKGAQIEVISTGVLVGTIDKHDPIWAKFNFSEPRT